MPTDIAFEICFQLVDSLLVREISIDHLAQVRASRTRLFGRIKGNYESRSSQQQAGKNIRIVSNILPDTERQKPNGYDILRLGVCCTLSVWVGYLAVSRLLDGLRGSVFGLVGLALLPYIVPRVTLVLLSTPEVGTGSLRENGKGSQQGVSSDTAVKRRP